MIKAKVFVLDKHFDGFPKPGDLKLIEEDLPPIKDGEFLAEALFLSVDPYMRPLSAIRPLGQTFFGQQVALIKESRHPNFPEGKYVVGSFGWRTHTVMDDEKLQAPLLPTLILHGFEGLPLSWALGVLGMPGIGAYFGLLEICKLKADETVVVSDAAGGVGCIVGQIAKIKGCKVVGITNSDEKLKWLVDDLGFDGAINYRTQNVGKVLKDLAPQGIDCYFDNVGGEITAIVLNQMNQFGRVAIFGVNSAHNDRNPMGTLIEFSILFNQLRIEGFYPSRFADRWTEGISQNLAWIKQGKMKYRETVMEGFENMFDAFINMLKGKHIGKAIVKV